WPHSRNRGSKGRPERGACVGAGDPRGARRRSEGAKFSTLFEAAPERPPAKGDPRDPQGIFIVIGSRRGRVTTFPPGANDASLTSCLGSPRSISFWSPTTSTAI